MSDDVAPGVKSILKAIDSGVKLGKRVARSSVYAPAAQVLQISDSAQKLQKSLAGSSKAIKDAYNESVEKCGAPFVNALLDESENNLLKELRIDLIDQTDKCQDFDENPLLFDPSAFTNVQRQGEKCCNECIAIFHSVRERLLLTGLQTFTLDGSRQNDREQLQTARQNRANSVREANDRAAAMRDAPVRKPVPTPSRQPTHIGQLQITTLRPAKPSSPWLIENAPRLDANTPISAVSSLTASLGTSPRTLGPNSLQQQSPRDILLPSPATTQGSQLIPWELVHSRINTNDEFLERRRQSRVLFQNELRLSVNSIEEDRASETFSEGVLRSPVNGVAEMPGSSPVEGRISRSSSSGYDTYVSRERSQGHASQATRSSRGSSVYPLSSPITEQSISGTVDKWTAMTSNFEAPPGYGIGYDDGLEVVPDPNEKERLAAIEKERQKFEKERFDTDKELNYEPGLEMKFETGLETQLATGLETRFANGQDPRSFNNGKMLEGGDEKMVVTAEPSVYHSTPATSVRSIDHPMRHDTSFYKSGGFCEGARLMIKGESGFKVVKRPSGHYSATVSARCIKCCYEVGWNDVEKDRLLDRSGIYGNSGIRWRQKFISKCHVKTASIEEPLYACVFCIEDNKTVEEHDATVFFSVGQLFRHLAKHSHPVPYVAGISVLYGLQPPDMLDFDLHFQNNEPVPAQWTMAEIATKVATRPSAHATIVHHPKSTARTYRDPDGNQTLHFAAGAKIVGITFPDRFNGQWCVGYHDGDRGSFPATNIMLEMPQKEDVLMNPQSSLVAVAKWDFKPKDAIKDGGWLKFSKGDKITCIGYTFQDQWCWSGQTGKGKWGLFPASFVEKLEEGSKLPPSSPSTSRGLSFASRMPSFALKKSKKTERQASIRSNGSGEPRESNSAGNVAVHGQPGLEVAPMRSVFGSRRG